MVVLVKHIILPIHNCKYTLSVALLNFSWRIFTYTFCWNPLVILAPNSLAVLVVRTESNWADSAWMYSSKRYWQSISEKYNYNLFIFQQIDSLYINAIARFVYSSQDPATSERTAVCSDEPGSCGRNLCDCSVAFANTIAEIESSGRWAYHSKSSVTKSRSSSCPK